MKIGLHGRMAGTPATVVRLPVAGVDTNRYSVLIVRDGEHRSPRMAAAISAVRSVSAELRASVAAAAERPEGAPR